MLPGTQKKSNILLLSAIALAILSMAVLAKDLDSSQPGAAAFMALFAIVRIVAAVLWFWGLSVYAKGRGYSPWLGALGLLSLIGLIILAVLPDRTLVAPNQPENPNQFPQ